jgi:biotin-(acetyl-CoA carboxylase) ligase
MTSVTLELDDATYSRLARVAETAGVSVAEWVRQQLTREVGQDWPADVVALVGVWPDCPGAEVLRGSPAADAPREDL